MEQACATYLKSMEVLKKSIRSVARSMDPKEVSMSVKAFRSRAEAVLEAGRADIP